MQESIGDSSLMCDVNRLDRFNVPKSICHDMCKSEFKKLQEKILSLEREINIDLFTLELEIIGQQLKNLRNQNDCVRYGLTKVAETRHQNQLALSETAARSIVHKFQEIDIKSVHDEIEKLEQFTISNTYTFKELSDKLYPYSSSDLIRFDNCSESTIRCRLVGNPQEMPSSALLDQTSCDVDCNAPPKFLEAELSSSSALEETVSLSDPMWNSPQKVSKCFPESNSMSANMFYRENENNWKTEDDFEKEKMRSWHVLEDKQFKNIAEMVNRYFRKGNPISSRPQKLECTNEPKEKMMLPRFFSPPSKQVSTWNAEPTLKTEVDHRLRLKQELDVETNGQSERSLLPSKARPFQIIGRPEETEQGHLTTSSTYKKNFSHCDPSAQVQVKESVTLVAPSNSKLHYSVNPVVDETSDSFLVDKNQTFMVKHTTYEQKPTTPRMQTDYANEFLPFNGESKCFDKGMHTITSKHPDAKCSDSVCKNCSHPTRSSHKLENTNEEILKTVSEMKEMLFEQKADISEICKHYKNCPFTTLRDGTRTFGCQEMCKDGTLTVCEYALIPDNCHGNFNIMSVTRSVFPSRTTIVVSENKSVMLHLNNSDETFLKCVHNDCTCGLNAGLANVDKRMGSCFREGRRMDNGFDLTGPKTNNEINLRNESDYSVLVSKKENYPLPSDEYNHEKRFTSSTSLSEERFSSLSEITAGNVSNEENDEQKGNADSCLEKDIDSFANVVDDSFNENNLKDLSHFPSKFPVRKRIRPSADQTRMPSSIRSKMQCNDAYDATSLDSGIELTILTESLKKDDNTRYTRHQIKKVQIGVRASNLRMLTKKPHKQLKQTLQYGKLIREFLNAQGIQTFKDLVRELNIDHRTVKVFGLGSYFDRLNRGDQLSDRERMQYEWLRLASFQHYTGNGNALSLARNGFYHDPSDGPSSTRCYICEARHSSWEYFDDVEAEHRRLSSNCTFLANRREESTNLSASYETFPQPDRCQLGSTTRGISPSGSSTQAQFAGNSSARVSDRTNVHENGPRYIRESVRETLSCLSQPRRRQRITGDNGGFPLSEPGLPFQALPTARALRLNLRTPTTISSTTNIVEPSPAPSYSERCGGNQQITRHFQHGERHLETNQMISVANWSTTYRQSTGFNAPALYTVSTSCSTSHTSTSQSVTASALAAACSRLQAIQPTIGGGGRTDPTISVVVENAKHPDYRELDPRINSYQGWPDHLDQTPRQIAEAGFFFVGVPDFTRCFCCGGELRNWGPGDDPVLEHARWFPRCEYVNKLKGERYVADVQRSYQQHMEEQQRQQHELARSRDDISEQTGGNEKSREMYDCRKCMQRPINTTFLPCGHFICCEQCAAQINRCPVCRKRIYGFVKKYTCQKF